MILSTVSLKHESQTTVLLRTPITQMIFINQGTANFIARRATFFKIWRATVVAEKHGVILNNTYANKKSCSQLVSFLSLGFRGDLILELNSQNYFSLMAGGTADFGGKENETVVCHFVRDGEPENCVQGHKAVTHANMRVNLLYLFIFEFIPYLKWTSRYNDTFSVCYPLTF